MAKRSEKTGLTEGTKAHPFTAFSDKKEMVKEARMTGEMKLAATKSRFGGLHGKMATAALFSQSQK